VDTIWCELLTTVRSNLYVTLIFDKTEFTQNYVISGSMRITCQITDYAIRENKVLAGDITTYLLYCKPLKKEDPTQAKIYQLFDVIDKADIDPAFMSDIDNVPVPYPSNSAFQIGDFPVRSGKYTIYKFLATYWGDVSISTQKQIIYDLLLIKTNNKHEILEAYQYTLNWTDSPSIDLYYAQNLKMKLAAQLNISNLALANDQGELLEQNALLDNVLKGIRKF